MKKAILLFAATCTLSGVSMANTLLHPQTKVISVLDFGAKPNDGKDDTKALRKAAEFCRNNQGTTLEMPAGIYQLRDAKAEKLEKDILAGKMGPNPEETIFTPYYPSRRKQSSDYNLPIFDSYHLNILYVHILFN